MKNLQPLMVFLEKSESRHYKTATEVSTLNRLMSERDYMLVRELEFDNLYVRKDFL